MSTKRYQLETYKKYLLNRVTATQHFKEYIENCLIREEEAAQHSFHKVMVHNWAGDDATLFDTLAEYFSASFVPVNYISHDDISTFYTSSLYLILKITKLDFMFPHKRNMYNLDVLFNDKASADCFDNRITVEDVVTGIVSNRINERCELDLSDFCNDPEFTEKKIHFYKLGLLKQFKILMLRMGRDTTLLNISSNKLSQVPIEILNFFIKGDLTAINLSNNDIPLMSELHRVSSKVERLWVEGNPLCEEVDPVSYVKQLLIKFPRLTELDGIKLNEHGFILPFFKNYLYTPDKRTKMLVEKFLSIYFAHYDATPRKAIEMFYAHNSVLTLSTGFTAAEEAGVNHYARVSRNACDPLKRGLVVFNTKIFRGRDNITKVFMQFPESSHDFCSFTVDVLKHDKKALIIIIDGIFKEKCYDFRIHDRILQFRRTIVFHIQTQNMMSEYFITNEMLSISSATKVQADNSFKISGRCTNPLALRNPDADDIDTFCLIFSHLTHLKRPEAELRLKFHSWDMMKALQEFMEDMIKNVIPPDMFNNYPNDFSNLSSLVDDID